MSARPPATRDAFELLGGLFHLRQDRPPPRGARQRQTRRKPGTQSHEATARRSRATPVEPPQPLRRVLCFLERHGVLPWRLPSPQSSRAIYSPEPPCPATKRPGSPSLPSS